MNSICKKFKKVISSVVLSCSMICSGGFASASLVGEGKILNIDALRAMFSVESESESKKLSNHFKEVKANANQDYNFSQKKFLDRVLYVVSPEKFGPDKEIWKEYCTCNCTKKIREEFINAKKNAKKLKNKGDTIFGLFYDLVDECSKKVEKNESFCEFSLACYAFEYLKNLGIPCNIFGFSPENNGHLEPMDGENVKFGVILLSQNENSTSVNYLLPNCDIDDDKYNIDINFNISDKLDKLVGKDGKGYVFLDKIDTGEFLLSSKADASYNNCELDTFLVTPDSWGECADEIFTFGENPYGKLELIESNTVKELVSEKSDVFSNYNELISKERGFFSNFFSNNKKK